MKRITVNAYQKALVTKRGKLISVLSEGKHWVGFTKKVQLLDITKPFIVTEYLQLMFDSSIMHDYIKIVDVNDNQIGLEYRDNKFTRVLTQGKYAYWKESVLFDLKVVELNDKKITDEVQKYILQKPKLNAYLDVFSVDQNQKALLFVNGVFTETLNEGKFYYWKTASTKLVKTIDQRLQLMEVVGQEILTKDKAALRLNFTLQYKVDDYEKVLLESKDYVKQIYNSTQLILREYIGTMTLDQLLSNKESIGSFVTDKTIDVAKIIGIKVLSGGIKDIILPGDVKEIMNQVLLAQKQAQANSIMRHEETASTRSLLNTAKLMEQNTMLMKLKEMEYMEKIADKIGEISINGKGRVVDQLADLLVTTKP